MKRVLITGAKSYIGEAVKDYLMATPDSYDVHIKDTMGWEPQASDFEGYDVVFNVAGIAHIKETSENRHLYYDVNRDLVIKIAKSAKDAGVKQFILLSTMSVYGLVTGRIEKSTPTNPINAYGKSKKEADEAIEMMADDSFKFANCIYIFINQVAKNLLNHINRCNLNRPIKYLSESNFFIMYLCYFLHHHTGVCILSILWKE